MPFSSVLQMYNRSREGVIVTDADGFITYLNPGAGKLLRQRLSSLVGRHLQAALGESVAVGGVAALGAGGNTAQIAVYSERGTLQPCFVSITPMHDADGKLLGHITVLSDDPGKPVGRSLPAASRTANRLLSRLTKSQLTRLNQRELLQAALDIFCQETGWTIAHVFQPAEGDPQRLVSADLWHLPKHGFDAFQQVSRNMSFLPGVGLPGRVALQRRPIWITDTEFDEGFLRAKLAGDLGIRAGVAFPVFAQGQLVAVLEFFDVRPIIPDSRLLEAIDALSGHLGLLIEQRRQRRELRKLANTDELTGAANRRYFDVALQAALQLAGNGTPSCLCLLDLDHFKAINDQLGHHAGDRILIEVVRVVQQSIRAGDVLARFGGDELALIVQGSNVGDTRQLLERIRSEAKSSVQTGAADIALTMSVGVQLLDGTRNLTAESALKRADRALYQAKQSGRDRIVALS